MKLAIQSLCQRIDELEKKQQAQPTNQTKATKKASWKRDSCKEKITALQNKDNCCAFIAAVHALHDSKVANSHLADSLSEDEGFRKLQRWLNSRDLESTDILEVAQTINDKVRLYTEQPEYQIGECQDAAEIIIQLKNLMSMMRSQPVNEEEAQVVITCKCRTKIVDQRFLLIKHNAIAKGETPKLGKVISEYKATMGTCTVCHEDKTEKIVKAGDEMIVGFDLQDPKDGKRFIRIKEHTTAAGKRMIVDAVILGNRDANHYKCVKRYVNHKGVDEWWDMDGAAKRVENLEKAIKDMNDGGWDVRVVLLKKDKNERQGKNERGRSRDSSRSRSSDRSRSRSASHSKA